LKTALSDILLQKGFITQSEHENVRREHPISVYWDLRSLLYLGVLLVTTAIGILIYKNIDTIGHGVLLIVIALLVVTCFAYCLKKSKGYQHTKVNVSAIWPDYILLAGCLLLLTLVAFAQFQYNLFGSRWGLALFIPMVLLFISAYYFDHLGVLSLAITNLAAWAGIAITPVSLLQQSDFNEERVMFTGLLLGIFLLAISVLSQSKNIKRHFAFTYRNFGVHLFFIFLLAILFYYDRFYLLIFLILTSASFFLFKSFIKENSIYFLVVTILYFYIGLSYVAVRMLSIDSIGGFYGVILYFIFSGIGLIAVFKSLQKKLKVQ
jgi:hypothetical protein